ncbi:MAG TPA: LptF/LptG family permease [Alphaproteobacteria bacterium]|nr:LptF/LptG family permease [Alphaproteobacteria bacterium]
MQTLPRYFATELIKPTILALAVLLGIIWLQQSMTFLDFVINKGLGLGTFLQLTVLLVPRLLLIVLPLALFAGVAAAARRWVDDNEYLILAASGWPRWRLAIPAAMWGILGVMLAYSISFWVLPPAITGFKELQNRLRTMDGEILLEEGAFNQLGDNLMVYLKQRTSDTRLNGLLVHDTRDPDKTVTWFAKNGEVVLGPDGFPRLVLTNGLRQESGAKGTNMLQFAAHTLDLKQQMAHANTDRQRDMEEYSIGELIGLSKQTENPRIRQDAITELTCRLTWPLAALPLCLLGVALILKRADRRANTTRRLGIAGLVAVFYIALLPAGQGLLQGGREVGFILLWVMPILTTLWAMWLLREPTYV